MISIINVVSDSNIGGAGRCIINFLKYYDRSKYSVSVAVPRGSLLKEEVEKLQTPVWELDGLAEKSFSLPGVKNLTKLFRREKPDVVHTHGAVSGRIAGKLCGAQVVYTRHSVFPVSEKIKHGLGKRVNQILNEGLADQILAVAEAAKENLTDGGISPEKIKVILNGVEALPKATADEKANLREKFGIQPEDFVIGIAGRLEEVKGHQCLLDAVQMLKKENRPIKALIAGTGTLEQSLKQRCIEMGLQDNVSFTGFLSDIAPFLNVLDAQVNASFGTEATSLALLEGMSLGLPTIASDYGGNPGVVDPGVNGFLFPQKDASAFAKEIAKLMDFPALLSQLQQGALNRYQKEFTAEQYARNIEAVYDECEKARNNCEKREKE